jgi:hypothetical protein
MREFSTGCTGKAEAQTIGAAEEARIRREFIDTGTVAEPVRVVTIHDCVEAYRSRPGKLHRFDVQRLDELDASIGGRHLSRFGEIRQYSTTVGGQHIAPPHEELHDDRTINRCGWRRLDDDQWSSCCRKPGEPRSVVGSTAR